VEKKDHVERKVMKRKYWCLFFILLYGYQTNAMTYLGYSGTELDQYGAIHTAREISQQPELWKKIYRLMESREKEILAFLNSTRDAQRIILTGAGTSAFIGMSLKGSFLNNRGVVTEAISSTDIVSHPKDYFHPDIPTLLVSFARSGNSPESAAAVAFADEICKTCYHLIITCNADGRLALHQTKNEKYVFNLPKEANDQSLAMTSSYSGMLLAGKLLSDMDHLAKAAESVEVISAYAEDTIKNFASEFRKIASLDFKRAVFLGAGPFFGTAMESELKLQELSDGRVVCKSDSYLGFRHGPKAVIDNTTLVAYIFSNNPYALKYEKDLVEAMKKGRKPFFEMGVSEQALNDVKLDFQLSFSRGGSRVQEDFLAIASVVPFQMLGFFKSIQLGLKPDAPSTSGAITRVVEGVHIYSMA
jgi:tagatose-6-phosphate ketose/aldose isomerase